MNCELKKKEMKFLFKDETKFQLGYQIFHSLIAIFDKTLHKSNGDSTKYELNTKQN